jgi:hypothetical protein
MSTDIDTGAHTDNQRQCALLVIDNQPIRRQLELKLQAVREAIEGCEVEIARHERLDLPAFRQWMAVKCSDLLNERRLIEEKIWGLRARLAAIHGLTQHGIRNVGAAFFWFREIEQDRTTIPPYVQRAWEEVTVGPAGIHRECGVEYGRFAEGSDDVEEEVLEERQDGTGDAVDKGSADRAEPDPGGREEFSRHKSLYRRIALLLHPDMAGLLTRQELELWYQAQRAYAEQDVVTLEIILARCDRVGTNSLTLSELRASIDLGDSRLATLGASIVGLARLPSWRFLLLKSSEAKVRLREVRRELEGVNRGLFREAVTMERELARFEVRAERWAERRKGTEKQLALGI